MHLRTQWDRVQGWGRTSRHHSPWLSAPCQPQPLLCRWTAGTGRNSGSSHLSHGGHAIFAWTQEAAGVKTPMPGSPFPACPHSRGHVSCGAGLSGQAGQQRPALAQGKPQQSHCGLQRPELPFSTAKQLLLPVPSKLLQFVSELAWRSSLPHQDANPPAGLRTPEYLDVHHGRRPDSLHGLMVRPAGEVDSVSAGLPCLALRD